MGKEKLRKKGKPMGTRKILVWASEPVFQRELAKHFAEALPGRSV